MTYIYKNNEQLGPFDDALILSSLQNSTFDYSDLCWREGWEDWKTLDSIYPKPNEKLERKNESGRQNNLNSRVVEEQKKTNYMLRGLLFGIGLLLLGIQLKSCSQ
jgi:hypothetical protein